MDFDLARYRCHLLAKGLTPNRVRTVLIRIAASPEKWRRRVAKWKQRDPDGEWKVVAWQAVEALANENLPKLSGMCVSVHSLMQLGLRPDAAFHVMCAITEACAGDDDYMYHYAPWDWLGMHLEQPLDGPGIFGANMHSKMSFSSTSGINT